ncbi:hypothetical protein TSAR_008238, partial [Trichomalopsis sarcophagae]
ITLLKSSNDRVLSCARANAFHHSTLWPGSHRFSFSALKVTLKIRGVKLLERVVAPQIALSIRAYESQMTEKRSYRINTLHLLLSLVALGYVRNKLYNGILVGKPDIT